MAGRVFSFNEDVSIKVRTHDNIPMTRYAEFIKYLDNEKPILMLNGKFVAYETGESGWHQADKEYAVEPVAEVGIVGKNDEEFMCDIETDDEKLMYALASAGMMRCGISTYEIKADKSKKFFHLTFHRMW